MRFYHGNVAYIISYSQWDRSGFESHRMQLVELLTTLIFENDSWVQDLLRWANHCPWLLEIRLAPRQVHSIDSWTRLVLYILHDFIDFKWSQLLITLIVTDSKISNQLIIFPDTFEIWDKASNSSKSGLRGSFGRWKPIDLMNQVPEDEQFTSVFRMYRVVWW